MDAPRDPRVLGEPWDLSPDEFVQLRIECDVELRRLGLSWKHERVRAFLGRCFPYGDTVDCADEATLEALLEKLRAITA